MLTIVLYKSDAILIIKYIFKCCEKVMKFNYCCAYTV